MSETGIDIVACIKRYVPEPMTGDCLREIESLRAEINEQARLNGMGAEREAKLQTQLFEEKRKREEEAGG